MLPLLQSRKSILTGAVALGTVVIAILVIVLWRWQKAKPSPPATYVGQETCAQCHAKQAQSWRTSHHAQAMRVADDSTVLGNFNDAHFAKEGLSSSFFKRDGKFYVRTEGPDGQLQTYELTCTFGLFPLQQYLVPFPNGRLQNFAVAWDSQSKEHDGQRWFDPYPERKAGPADPLHWTRSKHTWNDMCADCHSTHLQKNYDLATDSYETKWSDINVSCEACHGPGSNHVAWAQTHKKGAYKEGDVTDGLVVDLRPASGSWARLEPWNVGTKRWQGQTRSHNEINACAPCHSRRRTITNDYQPGQPLLDAYVPSLLDEGVYYPDGQILDEDYEWGPFLQSKMYREGVTCSDCHDPHSGKLQTSDTNLLCGKCHSLANFGNEQHHHHQAQSKGAQCVSCHMPTRTYMAVDEKHDHSFRVPRPDFSVAYGTPNACNECHRDKSANWAAETVAKWYGPGRKQPAQFVAAIDAGRRGLPNAERTLNVLIMDTAQPAIARATALHLLPQYLTPFSLPVVQASLEDEDDLVRRQAVKALASLSLQDRGRLAGPMLTDSVRSVRIEAARLLAGVPPAFLQGVQKAALDRAISELIASEMVSADRPGSHLNLARLYHQMGRRADEETELKTALRLDPNFVPAMVQLADLYRIQSRDEEGQQWLQRAIAVDPSGAEAIHSLGLLKIRHQQYAEGISLLAKAAVLRPSNVLYTYVYAVALNSSGHPDEAIAVLQQAHQRRPADRQVLIGLIAFERDKANLPSALTYAQQLVELAPNDSSAKAMLAELVLANDPKTYQHWLTEGDADYKSGHLPDAREAYQKGIDLASAELAANPQKGNTHAFVAYFAARLGDKTRAEQEAKQALKLSPDDDKVMRRVVLTYEALGERERAIQALSGASPQVLYALDRQPDLADFRQDLRFQQLIAAAQEAK